MLILRLEEGGVVQIGENITVKVVSVKNLNGFPSIALGFDAPRSVEIAKEKTRGERPIIDPALPRTERHRLASRLRKQQHN